MGKGRKVILFLVEGPSDETALIQPLKRIISTQVEVRSQPFYCDVTTLRLYPKGSVPFKGDAVRTVRSFVTSRIEERNEYRWTDLERIVQIVDLDGAFVDDAHVEDLGHLGLEYHLDRIVTGDVEGICCRNKEKAMQLRKLAATSALTYKRVHVPYEVYFMSRNLEHALYGLAGDLSDADKERLSRAFSAKCLAQPDYFVEVLERIAMGLGDSYQEAWGGVQSGSRSLERGSNLWFLTCKQMVSKRAEQRG